jgi:Ca-activated chloride channel family protein
MATLSFARPELLALVLLGPIVGWLAAWLIHRRLRVAEAWAGRGLWDRLLAGWSPRRGRAASLLLATAAGAFGLALAQPRFGGATETVERKGVDVVYVLDVSRSMAVEDVLPSRLAVGRATIRRLVEAMPGNRVGLVAAEGTGEVFSPLTTDGGVLDLVLDTLEPGGLQVPGTVLAPALDRALELFPPGGDKHRALVLVSDGEDHGGGLEGSADRLARAGVVVIALGVGTEQGGPVPDREAEDGVKRLADGTLVVSRLEPATLSALAERTEGLYLPVTDVAAPLEPALRAIGRLDRTSFESEQVDTRSERFQGPLLLAVLALAGYLALRPFGTARPAGPGSAPFRRAIRGPAVIALAVLLAAPRAISQAASPAGAPPEPEPVDWTLRLRHNPRAQTGAALGELAIAPDDPAAKARAAADLDSAARLAPANPLAQFNAGTGRLLAGRAAEAEAAFLRAGELADGPGEDSLGAALPFNLGNARFVQGDYDGAIEAYREALRLDPNLGDAKFNLELALRAKEPPPPQGSPPPEQEDPEPPREDQPQDQPSGSKDSPANPAPPPRPDFHDQPELDEQQARQLLQAVDQLEKKERRRQAEARQSSSPETEKDW